MTLLRVVQICLIYILIRVRTTDPTTVYLKSEMSRNVAKCPEITILLEFLLNSELFSFLKIENRTSGSKVIIIILK